MPPIHPTFLFRTASAQGCEALCVYVYNALILRALGGGYSAT